MPSNGCPSTPSPRESTASGATFSTPIEAASPIAASALVTRVEARQVPIALIDTGRSVALLSLENCRARPIANAQGEAYAFDKGFTGYGTGVACVEQEGITVLAGVLAKSDGAGSRYRIERTLVRVSSDGTRATNGARSVVARDVAAGDPAVEAARQTTCGDLRAGADGAGPSEPAS